MIKKPMLSHVLRYTFPTICMIHVYEKDFFHPDLHEQDRSNVRLDIFLSRLVKCRQMDSLVVPVRSSFLHIWLVSFRFYISLNSCRLSTNSVTSLSCPSLWHPRTPKQHEQHHTKK